MASQCTTQPPPSITICSQNCNKCVAGNTSRMLYNTLVKKLDDRDREQKKPVISGLLHESETMPHWGVAGQKTTLNPIPDPIPKRRKLVVPPETGSTTTTTTTYRSNDNFAQHRPLPKENITATAKCKLTIENAVTNANLLSKKPPTEPGLCTSLKTLDRRLDEMFDSPEVTHAFSVLRGKMEKDFKTKQLQLKVDYNDDTRMYFDTRDNYVSQFY